MDLQLRQMLQNFAVSQDPEDAVKFARAMLNSEERFPQPLEKPLSLEEVRKQIEDKEWVEGFVSIDLLTFLPNNIYDGFLDMLSEKLINSLLLQNIDHEIAGVTPDGLIIFKVGGQVDISDLD